MQGRFGAVRHRWSRKRRFFSIYYEDRFLSKKAHHGLLLSVQSFIKIVYRSKMALPITSTDLLSGRNNPHDSVVWLSKTEERGVPWYEQS